MKKRELINMGVPKDALAAGIQLTRELAAAKLTKARIRHRIRDIVADPEAVPVEDQAAELASVLIAALEAADSAAPPIQSRPVAAPWAKWGEIDEQTKDQMAIACELPVAFRGALMPDAHLGYGLPIGGVLATENAVVPYAIGVDIACRMKLSVFDMPAPSNNRRRTRLVEAIEEETRFGKGAHFRTRRQHEVLDRDWRITPITQQRKDLAWSQLGSSGGGNHFVEFGMLKIEKDKLGLCAGEYLALLSHSGSRGAGSAVCSTYSTIARSYTPICPNYCVISLGWISTVTPARNTGLR
jgi:tRNA-splicing ligase RtcB (3'-phosphate/5'-hydroxy nucleic acid ligase)